MGALRQPGLHIVGIGGGTGLSVLLSGLDRQARKLEPGRRPIHISAIVSVADDGGSTGMLRAGLGIPAVGDLRNCIAALCSGTPLWSELFQYRFTRGNELAGHALGNLIVAALAQRTGSLHGAIEELQRPLRLRGRVMPVSEDPITLGADLADGEQLVGESRIARSQRRIKKVWLNPPDARPAPGVLEAIASADAVVIGPGSLYTSLVPNLLVAGVADAIRRCRGLRIFVCNVMTQPGETDFFDATDHVLAIEEYLGRGAIDAAVVNGAVPPADVEARYAAGGSTPVLFHRRRGLSGALPVVADLLEMGNTLGRHDPGKLGEIVVTMARCLKRRAAPVLDARPPEPVNEQMNVRSLT